MMRQQALRLTVRSVGAVINGRTKLAALVPPLLRVIDCHSVSVRRSFSRGVQDDSYFNLTPKQYTSKIKNARSWEESIVVLEEMDSRGIEPNAIHFDVTINKCRKAREWKIAIDLLRLMEDRGLHPDVITYSSVISACEKGSQWEKALELLQEMKDGGLEPTVIAYSAAISACEKGGQWEKALDLLREIKDDGLQPDVITYSATISACEKGGRWQEALDLLQEMKERGIEPNEITFNATIIVCFHAKRYPEALKLVKRATEEGYYPAFASEKSAEWDLRKLPLPVSCMALADSLLTVVHSRRHELSSFGSITVVTGKGIGSDTDGPVLMAGVPQFLSDFSGPEISAIEENEGCFLISKEALQAWAMSSDFQKFNDLMTTSTQDVTTAGHGP